MGGLTLPRVSCMFGSFRTVTVANIPSLELLCFGSSHWEHLHTSGWTLECASAGTEGFVPLWQHREQLAVAQIPSQPPTASVGWKLLSLSLTEKRKSIVILLVYADKWVCAPSRCEREKTL